MEEQSAAPLRHKRHITNVSAGDDLLKLRFSGRHMCGKTATAVEGYLRAADPYRRLNVSTKINVLHTDSFFSPQKGNARHLFRRVLLGANFPKKLKDVPL